MRRLALISAAALLSACQPPQTNEAPDYAPADDVIVQQPTINAPAQPAPTPAPAPTPKPSKAQTDYRQDMRLTGTEPFWGVQINAGQIKMQRPDHADLVVTNPGPTLNGDVAVWSGRDLTVRLEPQADCSDGMSDNRYPYKATVTVKGEVLRGCAARADQWPRGGG